MLMVEEWMFGGLNVLLDVVSVCGAPAEPAPQASCILAKDQHFHLLSRFATFFSRKVSFVLTLYFREMIYHQSS
jgi:hypothetical protein